MTILKSLWIYFQAILRYFGLRRPATIHHITADELKKLLEAKNDSIIVVNALAEKYHQDCHIPDSINAPFHKIPTIARNWDKSKTYIVYCADKACTASTEAALQLLRMGFKHVIEYEGGIREWKDKRFPTSGACKMPFLLYKIT